MYTKYVLEVWDSKTRRYVQCWTGDDIEWANKMYDKPYHKRHTRRIVKVSREVLFRDKGSEK